MNYRVCFFILLLCSCLFAQELPPVDQGPEEELIPEEAELQKWNKAFADAEGVFNSENQTQSIPLFQDLVGKITAEKMKRPLTEPERLLLYRSLDYLGRAFYVEGQQEEAKNVFLKLIENDPNYRLDEELVSPKIIAFVEEIKSENLGQLSISSTPPEATIEIDGVPVGKTDLATLYSLKGTHEIEVIRPGYFSQIQTVEVVPGKTQKISFKLERSSSVAYFITYPKGVEVIFRDKSLGFTEGTAPERAQATATERNLPVTEFSAEFPISELQPGEYEVTFQKPCWETPNRRLTITANDDYYFTPIIMEPAKATLNITADDPQANIFIDNEYKGLAPKTIQTCPGKHVVKLKGPFGKFEKQVELKNNQAMEISAKLNPSLSFLGIVSFSAMAKAQLERFRQETIKELEDLKSLNFQDNSKSPDRAALEEAIQEIAISLEDGKPDGSRQEKIQQVCSKVESDLLLFGLVPEKAEERTVEYYLLSNWSSMADIRKIQTNNPAHWAEFQAQLEYDQPLFEKRLGIQSMDTAITPGPVIAKLTLKTFQETQPLLIGDVVTAIQDKPVKTTEELLAAARELQKEGNVRLSVSRGGTQSTIPVQLMLSAMEIDYTDPKILFNRQMASFKKVAGLDRTSGQEKHVAALNVALCHMHFKEYDRALDQLQQVELDRAVGIGPGTVKFRMAQVYRALGRLDEAKQSLTEALRAQQNTIGSDDGLPLAAEAERLQKAISTSPGS
ncbi:PEGA domain-containing protein [bacterium]|nr:PEGA domain-containing protein [bacterium]